MCEAKMPHVCAAVTFVTPVVNSCGVSELRCQESSLPSLSASKSKCRVPCHTRTRHTDTHNTAEDTLTHAMVAGLQRSKVGAADNTRGGA